MSNAEQTKNETDNNRYTPAQLLDDCIYRNQSNTKLMRPICDLDHADPGPCALMQVKYWGRRDHLKLLRIKFFSAAIDYFCAQGIGNRMRAGFITDMCALALAEHIDPNTLFCEACNDHTRRRSVHYYCEVCGGVGSRPLLDHHRADFLTIPIHSFIVAWKPVYQHLQGIAEQWERSAIQGGGSDSA